MTPEEQARADSINSALSASIQKRKTQHLETSSADNILDRKRKGAGYYCGILAVVVVLHLGGFFIYTTWQDKREASANALAAERRRLDAEYARLEAQRRQIERQAQVSAVGSSNVRSAQVTYSHPQRSTSPTSTPHAATPATAAQSTPIRQQNPRQQPPQITQPPVAPPPTFTDADHTQLILAQARTYFSDEYAKHLGVMDTWVESINAESVFHDKLWDKYVIKGKVTVGYSTRGPGGIYKRTLEFEGETKIKNGKIQISSNVRPK